MRIKVEHSIGDLGRDMARVPVQLYREGRGVVTRNARSGGMAARRISKWTAGAHGKHYPGSITWDRATSFGGFGGGEIKAEYGPESSRPQGGMSFEEGSRNQPPHHDLATSLDIIRPAFHRDTEHMLDGLFWPGAG